MRGDHGGGRSWRLKREIAAVVRTSGMVAASGIRVSTILQERVNRLETSVASILSCISSFAKRDLQSSLFYRPQKTLTCCAKYNEEMKTTSLDHPQSPKKQSRNENTKAHTFKTHSLRNSHHSMIWRNRILRKCSVRHQHRMKCRDSISDSEFIPSLHIFADCIHDAGDVIAAID